MVITGISRFHFLSTCGDSPRHRAANLDTLSGYPCPRFGTRSALLGGCFVSQSATATRKAGDPMKDLIVRVVLVLIVAVVAMTWLGWLTFDHTNESATIELNTHEVERAADKAAEAGRELVEETKESIHEVTEPDTPKETSP